MKIKKEKINDNNLKFHAYDKVEDLNFVAEINKDGFGKCKVFDSSCVIPHDDWTYDPEDVLFDACDRLFIRVPGSNMGIYDFDRMSHLDIRNWIQYAEEQLSLYKLLVKFLYHIDKELVK